MWFSTLEELSDLLKDIWQKSDIDRETMIVRRGNDSTTWNNMASAWNKARDNWIALVYALKMQHILETLCFGKVLRLMAADVAYWHRSTGGELDPNTLVWRELPLPWEVLAGEAECNLSIVRSVCKKHNINPEKSGWISPRPRSFVAKYRPTPELVHGVSVASPFLAKVLRDKGFFSGKRLKGESLPGDAITHSNILHDHHRRLVEDDEE